jgi:hypothetical protein
MEQNKERESFDLNKIRLDFKIEKYDDLGDDKKGNKLFSVRLVLDPKHWEHNKEGKYYLNKKLGIAITEDALRKALPSVKGKPIYLNEIAGSSDEDYLKKYKEKYE